MAEKVLVGMSGGVDSAVAACLLKKEGYEVIGIHMRFWSEKPPGGADAETGSLRRENKCCSIESWELAAEIARKIGIPFHVLDLEAEFREKIVDYYLQEQSSSLTPNPCIECNRLIKFGKFLEARENYGAAYVATGHYVRRVERKLGTEIEYRLLTALDPAKDQSYFLYTLNQEKLKHVLFPLGDYTKAEVRKMAGRFGLDFINQKKESQNLCFIPEKTPEAFLKRNLPASLYKPGPICTVEGREVGRHEGLPNYTIGQRRGIKIGGIKGQDSGDADPWYVAGFDSEKNRLIVGREKDLFHRRLPLRKVNFIGESVSGGVEAKIRFRSPSCPANVRLLEGGRAEVEFERGQRAVTPGQSVVFYRGEELLGGGIIEKCDI